MLYVKSLDYENIPETFMELKKKERIKLSTQELVTIIDDPEAETLQATL